MRNSSFATLFFEGFKTAGTLIVTLEVMYKFTNGPSAVSFWRNEFTNRVLDTPGFRWSEFRLALYFEMRISGLSNEQALAWLISREEKLVEAFKILQRLPKEPNDEALTKLIKAKVNQVLLEMTMGDDLQDGALNGDTLTRQIESKVNQEICEAVEAVTKTVMGANLQDGAPLKGTELGTVDKPLNKPKEDLLSTAVKLDKGVQQTIFVDQKNQESKSHDKPKG
jgi:hypothetical protein